MQNMEFQAEGVSCRLRGARNRLSKSRDCRVDQKSHSASCGQKFVQQLQPLRSYLDAQTCHTRYVAAGMVKAGDQPKGNWVCRRPEHNWDANCRRLRGQRGSSATGGHKYNHLIMNQLRRKLRQSIGVRLRPTIVDGNVLA